MGKAVLLQRRADLAAQRLALLAQLDVALPYETLAGAQLRLRVAHKQNNALIHTLSFCPYLYHLGGDADGYLAWRVRADGKPYGRMYAVYIVLRKALA